MQASSDSDFEWAKELEDFLKDHEEYEEENIPNKESVKKSGSVPKLVDDEDKMLALSHSDDEYANELEDLLKDNEEDMMQELTHSDDEWANQLEEDLLKDHEDYEEPKSPKERLIKKSVSVPELVVKEDYMESTSGFSDKVVGKKRQMKNNVLSGFEKTKKKKKQDSLLSSAEVEEMWDHITNNKNTKDGDKFKVKSPKKEDDDGDAIDKLQTSSHSDNEWANQLEHLLKDHEDEDLHLHENVGKNRPRKKEDVSGLKKTKKNFTGSKPISKAKPSNGTVRVEIPKPSLTNFKIRPNSKIHTKLESRVKIQMDNNSVHERILKRWRQRKSTCKHY